MTQSKRLAVIDLLFVGLLWGFGFIAIKWGIEGFSSLYLNFLRFALAAAICGAVGFALPRFRARLNWSDLKVSLVPGVLIGLTLTLQAYGLEFTTITNSSFITTLYVVMVPLAEALRTRGSLTLANAGFAGIALLGTALLTGVFTSMSVNVGDFYTFLCALTATFHILWLQKNADRLQSLFTFNLGQFACGSAVAWIAVMITDAGTQLPPLAHVHPWLGLFVLTIGATLIALILETRAQRVLSAFVASLLYLLEAPIAAAFAFLLLGESLGMAEMLGAALIIASAVLGLRYSHGSVRGSVPSAAVPRSDAARAS